MFHNNRGWSRDMCTCCVLVFCCGAYMYVRMLFYVPFCWIEYSNINCYAILFMNSTQFGRSALSHAAELGHLSIVRLMIHQFGCSVEESTNVSIGSTSVAILAALIYLQRQCIVSCIICCNPTKPSYRTLAFCIA